jgi:isoleucyl-tRNA synthetase
MRLDGYDPASADLDDGELSIVDRWVLSRLQTVKREMTGAWEEYRLNDALNALLSFVTDDVSRFYVKAIRARMWEEEDSASKRGAYATLSTVLSEVVRLIAPYTPYLAERMYQHLDGSEVSVHALSWPEVDEGLLDEELERNMAVLRRVEEAAANARQQGGRKLRWPVPRVIVETDDDEVAEALDSLEALLLDRVNARSLEVVSTFDELVEHAEPRMSVIGPAFGGDAQRIMQAVQGQTRDALTSDGSLAVELDGETYELDDEMVEFRAEPPENVAGAAFDRGTVFVDTSLTEEIEAEGYARDIVRRVQEMRKQLDLDVEENIRTALVVEDDRVADLVARHTDFIAEETRTTEFAEETPDEDEFDLVEEWDVEGVDVTIGIERLEAEQRAA